MSSFRKRNVQKPLPGTRTSPQTGQVITSSGNPSVDLILGGGLPIGSVCLIEEDKYVTHSKVLAKYFIAEGILSTQSVFLGSLDDDPAELLRKLPRPLNDNDLESEKDVDDKNDDEKSSPNGLRIAWRYNDLPIVNSEQASIKIGHHFNLMEHINPVLVDYAEITVWNGTQETNFTEEGADYDDDSAEVEDHIATLIEPVAVDGIAPASAAGELLAGADTDWGFSPIAALEQQQKQQEQEHEQQHEQQQEQQHQLQTQQQQKTEELLPYLLTPPPPIAEESLKATPPPPPPQQKAKIFENEKYASILNDLHAVLREDKVTAALHGKKGLCRVCITSLGSPLWYDAQFAKDILKFLTLLRAAVRGSVAVCMITMPMHLVAKCDETLIAKIRNLVDYSIELESFAGSERETHPAYKEYSGLLHMRAVSAINALSAYRPEVCDLAFKLRRKKFVIEKFHLPPELQDNTDNDNENTVSAKLGCASNTSSNPMDF